MAKNKNMAAKNRKVKVLGMKASKERALSVSMQELIWGDWHPYFIMVKADGVAMYKGHAEFMKAWKAKKEVMA